MERSTLSLEALLQTTRSSRPIDDEKNGFAKRVSVTESGEMEYCIVPGLD